MPSDPDVRRGVNRRRLNVMTPSRCAGRSSGAGRLGCRQYARSCKSDIWLCFVTFAFSNFLHYQCTEPEIQIATRSKNLVIYNNQPVAPLCEIEADYTHGAHDRQIIMDYARQSDDQLVNAADRQRRILTDCDAACSMLAQETCLSTWISL